MAPQLSQAGASSWNVANCWLRIWGPSNAGSSWRTAGWCLPFPFPFPLAAWPLEPLPLVCGATSDLIAPATAAGVVSDLLVPFLVAVPADPAAGPILGSDLDSAPASASRLGVLASR